VPGGTKGYPIGKGGTIELNEELKYKRAIWPTALSFSMWAAVFSVQDYF